MHLLCISGFQPKQDFLVKSRHLYGSEPAVVKSLQQINDWVYNATNGKMPEFLSALPPNLVIMLINAIHFKGITFLQLDPQHTCASAKVLARDLLIKFSLLPKGEWVARFDPRFTSRGVFYIDDKNMIDVEIMEDAKHPLSLFIDNELDAQVTRNAVARSGWKRGGKWICHTFFCAGGKIPVHDADKFAGGDAHVWRGQHEFAFSQAECVRPVQASAKGEGRSSESSQIQTGICTGAAGCFY